MTTRGIRNNNPGNIRWGQGFQGELSQDAPNADPDFCQFISPQYGIRAIVKILVSYRANKQAGIKGLGLPGIDTIREIIGRWAPTIENDTLSYITSVSQTSGFGPDTPLGPVDRDEMARIVPAIILHENGVQPYSTDVINEAITLAGIGS